MDSTMILTALLMLAAGIGVFLMSCNMLSSNLESISSSKLRAMFSKASKSKIRGVGIGAVSTAAIQSSGATTVLVIGFVNAGIMSLPLAASIIYGANIGTTITAQIVALGSFGSSISMTSIFSAFAGIGAFMSLFAKSDKYKKVGGIVAGFGLLFVGLSLMSDSMEGFAELPEVKELLASINNVILLVIVGVILTAIVQSSSVVTGLAVVMVAEGLITLEQGIYITLGSNIGSCIVAVIAGFTSGLNAKRTALIHLLFNTFGVILFVIIGYIMKPFGIYYSTFFEAAFPGMGAVQLAMFHTFFNCTVVLIMLPLTNKLISIVMKILPDKHVEVVTDDSVPHLYYVNDLMLRTPAIAVEQVKNEIINMSRLAMENFRLSYDMIQKMNFDRLEDFKLNEERIDYLNKEVARFLVKLSNQPLSSSDSIYVSTAYKSLTDLERIGDYAENIVEYAVKMKDTGEGFSSVALEETAKVEQMVEDLYDKILLAYTNKDRRSLEVAYDIEEQIDVFTDEMAANHIKRLNDGVCTLDVGAKYLALASDTERVADHLINFGKTIRDLKPHSQ